MPSTPKRRESELAPPITEYLISQGYNVRSEVRDCDITAIKDDTLVIVELKTGFTTDLLIQAMDRQRVADAVYVGLPAEGSLAKSKHFDKRRRGIEAILKRLEIGLILVHFSKIPDAPPSVEVALHPITEAKPRQRPKKRQVILREIAGRSGDYNVGGSTGRKLITAYREQAIFLAVCLEKHGQQTPAMLCKMGATPKAQRILLNNVYGWFSRLDRGLYAVHARAIDEIERDYPQVLAFARNLLIQSMEATDIKE